MLAKEAKADISNKKYTYEQKDAVLVRRLPCWKLTKPQPQEWNHER
jgi:hypothetical protein